MSVQNNVKISVLMSTYNPQSRKMLEDAVISICKQTFTEWELILYDDGSDDCYTEEIKAVAAMDSRIRFIRGEKNHGLAYGLNQCLKEARGKYVARMDDDDISDCIRFEKEYVFLENHPEYQWIGTNSLLFDDYGFWGEEKCPEIPAEKDFLSHSPYIHPSVIFRRRELINAGGYKVSWNTIRSEDYELFMRLHAMGYRGYNLQEPLIYYREDANSYKRKKFRYRIQEMTVRGRGFGKLRILTPMTMFYVVKPVIVGCIPSRVIKYVKKRAKKGFIC